MVDDTTFRAAGELLDDKIEEYNTTLGTINARLDAVEAALNDLEPRTGGENFDPTELQEQIDNIRSGLEENSVSLVEVQNALDVHENEITKLKTTVGQDTGALDRLEVVGNPDHTRIVKTGIHQDSDYHEYGSWGIIVEASRAVHWQDALVNAKSGGTTLLEVYPIDNYSLGKRYKTRELSWKDGGEQTVHPEVTLPKGTWFITRDTERSNPVPLKRTDSDVNWAELTKATGDIPLTFKRTWQVGREPGTDAFKSYEASGWHKVLHNWADLKFAYMG